MAAQKKVVNLIVGIVIGACISQLINRGGDVCEAPNEIPSPLQVIGEDVVQNTKEKLLFVGVMTAAKYLNGRAKAVYETWGKSVPGKIVFFSSEESRSGEIPLVPLIGVDDTYPPQKKSFTMLKYMHDNYLERFEWFMRADDDVYVRTDKLEKLLRSVDSRKPWFIGQTGRGNSEEFGLLSLESDENFCMGGPGIILSRETLRKIGPNIETCLENLYTTHEDVELGRCVRKTAGISCTWSYEASLSATQMQVILYHNQSGQASFTGDLKQKEVHKAITLHPIKKPHYMHRLHKYVKSLKVQSDKQEFIRLHRDIAISMSELNVNLDELQNAELMEDIRLFEEPIGSDFYLGEAKLLGIQNSLNRFRADRLEDVLDWELISKSLFSYKDSNAKRRLGSSMKEGLGDVVREVMEIINLYSKQRGRIIDFKEIFYGYWRMDPVHGVDLILDLLLVYRKYRGHKMTVPVRRHAYVQQTFTGIQTREVDVNATCDALLGQIPFHRKIIHHVISTIGENIPPIFGPTNVKKRINFILPLRGRFATFKRFLSLYEDLCILEQENAELIVILYKDGNEYFQNFHLIQTLKEKYKSRPNNDNLVRVKIVEEEFSRAKALDYGVNLMQNDDLLFFVDVDVVFNRESLLRIRQNTLKNKLVYFPIVYSLFNNPQSYQDINKYANASSFVDNFMEDSGAWRQFGFGIVSLYKADYITLGGFNMSISGWGYEDVNFYDKVIREPRLRVVRCVDPGLVHAYHPVVCDDRLDVLQMNMCKGSRGSTLGSLKHLQSFLKTHHHPFKTLILNH